MRKILMRGALSPVENNDPYEVLIEDLIGTNTGNMIFMNSVYRTLMVEDTVIDTIKIHNKIFTNEDIEEINNTYDYFVMPLANAFRKTFINELKSLTNLVKKLKIPCYVIGVGVQVPMERSMEDFYPYKDEAKEFINAVLEKSNIIGVRGKTTADFMKSLGYKEEKDFTVIGCPSMYTYGEDLPDFSNVSIDKNSKIAINSKPVHEKKPYIYEFFEELVKKYPNYTYFPQHIRDLRRVFFGEGPGEQKELKFYEDKNALAFTNMQKWFDNFKGFDLSVGTRIHGNIAAIIGGVPSIIIPPDNRVLELASYHNIPYIPIKDVENGINFEKILKETDFNSIHIGHKERFHHYVEFLDKNNLDHIYKHKYDGDAPFDKVVKTTIDDTAVLTPFDTCDTEEKIKRLEIARKLYENKFRDTIAINKDLRRRTRQFDNLVKENEKLHNYIESLGTARKLDSFITSVKHPKLLKLVIQEKFGKDVTEEAEKIKKEIGKL